MKQLTDSFNKGTLPVLVPSLVALFLTACSPESYQTPHVTAADPEGDTGWQVQEQVVTDDFMVVAANAYASDIGAKIIRQGGSAIDAAVAVQAALTLVEPQSSGIGGGAFILYWDANAQKLYTLDARETAPQAATPDLFLNKQGEAVAWIDAVVGGRSVGTPGVVKGLEAAHARFGVLPWEVLFEDTIQLATEGFIVPDRLAQLVADEINPGVKQLEPAKSYFFPKGQPIQAGSLQTNPALAHSLKAIAQQGAKALYEGPLAEEIVTAVQNSAISPGRLELEDLQNYRPVWREPVCGAYRTYEICSMGPPSSGGVTLIQTLKLLEPFDLGEAPNGQGIHYFTQASRLAFADRNAYSADPDFLPVPVTELLAEDYLNERRALITEHDNKQVEAGDLEGYPRLAMASLEQPNTSHFSIIDKAGNAVSMTTTIEMGFGSSVMVGGFLLNNQLTDFSLSPVDEQGLVANRVEANKRPRSSMSPVIVFDKETQTLKYVVGSPGGPRIINYVGLTLLGVLDWGLELQEAINFPRVTNMNGVTAVESGQAVEFMVEALKARGHEVVIQPLNSGLHGISVLNNKKLASGVDPRREGKASGD